MPVEESGLYTHERWNNWIARVKESGFTLNDGLGDSGKVFVYMEDDIILACLKIIAKYDRDILTPKDAALELGRVRNVVLEEIEPISNDIDIMLASLQTSLVGVIAACECYINGDYTDAVTPEDLIKEAVNAEAEEDTGLALYNIAKIGARMIRDRLHLEDSAIENVPDGMVAEWLDGLDSLSAAMLGDDSYKHDDE
ncbi:hypothetical protein B6U67_00320 [Methanosarcinales archaeon ex4484_138]|nr:MAG: hypothetical protein B6U67_00320 [Methanosarcinales archaeon ex4484_138]RLG26492.1 MAG: DUF2150 domain-containing protein [Methanosarcinales archaeon]HHI30346.1 DUF2150 family protein [Candidatus Methanoperedenaceae archaeon]